MRSRSSRENLGRTFATLLNLATTEGVDRTVSMNRMLAQGSIPGRRVVQVFRIAPVSRDLGTLEFNGHYDGPFSAPSPSLVEWMESGALHARWSERPFWMGTYRASPR